MGLGKGQEPSWEEETVSSFVRGGKKADECLFALAFT